MSWKFLDKVFQLKKKEGETEKEKETSKTTFFLSGFMTSDSQWGGCISEGKRLNHKNPSKREKNC